MATLAESFLADLDELSDGEVGEEPGRGDVVDDADGMEVRNPSFLLPLVSTPSFSHPAPQPLSAILSWPRPMKPGSKLCVPMQVSCRLNSLLLSSRPAE